MRQRSRLGEAQARGAHGTVRRQKRSEKSKDVGEKSESVRACVEGGPRVQPCNTKAAPPAPRLVNSTPIFL